MRVNPQEQGHVRWRKASRSSGQNGDCIELAHVGLVRDSKNPRGPVLGVNVATLVGAVRNGRISRH